MLLLTTSYDPFKAVAFNPALHICLPSDSNSDNQLISRELQTELSLSDERDLQNVQWVPRSLIENHCFKP